VKDAPGSWSFITWTEILGCIPILLRYRSEFARSYSHRRGTVAFVIFFIKARNLNKLYRSNVVSDWFMDWCDRYKLGRLVLVKTEMTEAKINIVIMRKFQSMSRRLFNLLDQCTEYVPV